MNTLTVFQTIESIRRDAASYLSIKDNIIFSKSCSNLEYAASVINGIRKNINQAYLFLNIDSKELSPVKPSIASFDNDVRSKFNSVMESIVDRCKELSENFERMKSSLAGYDVIFNEFISTVNDLSSLVRSASDVLTEDKPVSVESQDTPSDSGIPVDNIGIGDVYLVYNVRDKSISGLKVCRAIIQTGFGLTVSSNESGTGAVPSNEAVYVDFWKYIGDNDLDIVTNLIETVDLLYSLERDRRGDKSSVMSVRSLIDNILHFCDVCMDTDAVLLDMSDY